MPTIISMNQHLFCLEFSSNMQHILILHTWMTLEILNIGSQWLKISQLLMILNSKQLFLHFKDDLIWTFLCLLEVNVHQVLMPLKLKRINRIKIFKFDYQRIINRPNSSPNIRRGKYYLDEKWKYALFLIQMNIHMPAVDYIELCIFFDYKTTLRDGNRRALEWPSKIPH